MLFILSANLPQRHEDKEIAGKQRTPQQSTGLQKGGTYGSKRRTDHHLAA